MKDARAACMDFLRTKDSSWSDQEAMELFAVDARIIFNIELDSCNYSRQEALEVARFQAAA